MFYSHINHSIQHHNQNNNINNENFIGLSIKNYRIFDEYNKRDR